MSEPIAEDKSAPAATPAPAETTAPAVQPPAAAGGRVKSRHLLVLLAVAVTGAGSLMLLASAMRAPDVDPSGAPADGAPPAVDAMPAAVPPAVEETATPARPKWVTGADSRRALGANVVFELAADSDVDVWRKRVRPVLTVRCTNSATEVFVVTHSPASIESSSNQHTITVGFDSRDPLEQTWEHSVNHDALFAPNGTAMMRQIAGARRMTFSFVPFNASPTTITFNTAGFDAHLKSAARKCRGAT
jgi:hypothetical protein